MDRQMEGQAGVSKLIYQGRLPANICPLNFLEVGGITTHKCRSYGPYKLKI